MVIILPLYFRPGWVQSSPGHSCIHANLHVEKEPCLISFPAAQSNFSASQLDIKLALCGWESDVGVSLIMGLNPDLQHLTHSAM